MSLKQVARDTLALLEVGRYEAPSGATVSIADAQRAAVAGTRLFTPDQLAALELEAFGEGSPAIHVTDETTQRALRRLHAEEGVPDALALNFASARNHGGGFLNGAKAQEEDLCRCSGLFPTLLVEEVQPYYRANRAQESLLYTDHMIYSPRVPWFRVKGRGELLEAPYVASVLTAPAPNGGPLLARDPDAGPSILATFRRRWGHVLSLAARHRHRVLVLGAWGCGAFGNDPRDSALTLRGVLAEDRFAGAFDRIVFAIPTRGKRSAANHGVFADVFS